MFFINALRDFADGMTKGLSLYLTERNDFTIRTAAPGFEPDNRNRR
jgi:hypothetical protein